MLRCIRCSACINHCPVYTAIGGHAYGSVYSGPMGAVLTPGLAGLDAATHLPNASTFCGRCEQVCPVRIPLPRMLRSWRQREFERLNHEHAFSRGGKTIATEPLDEHELKGARTFEPSSSMLLRKLFAFAKNSNEQHYLSLIAQGYSKSEACRVAELAAGVARALKDRCRRNIPV